MIKNTRFVVGILVLVSLFAAIGTPKTSNAAITAEVYGLGPMSVTIATCNTPSDIFSSSDPLGTIGENSAGLFCLTGIAFKLFHGSTVLFFIAFFLVLVVGGIRYLTAGGDEKAMQTARKTLTYGVMGLGTAVVMVFMMIVFVNKVLNPMELDDLNNPIPSPFHIIIPDYFCTKNVGNVGSPIVRSYCNKK